MRIEQKIRMLERLCPEVGLEMGVSFERSPYNLSWESRGRYSSEDIYLYTSYFGPGRHRCGVIILGKSDELTTLAKIKQLKRKIDKKLESRLAWDEAQEEIRKKAKLDREAKLSLWRPAIRRALDCPDDIQCQFKFTHIGSNAEVLRMVDERTIRLEIDLPDDLDLRATLLVELENLLTKHYGKTTHQPIDRSVS